MAIPFTLQPGDPSLADVALLAREAGSLIRKALSPSALGAFGGSVGDDGGRSLAASKTSGNDLVTETDKAVERLIISRIRARFPATGPGAHAILAEESSTEESTLTDAPTWIIDPVDGTTNFAHGFPFTCVSIGFARGKTVLLGAVYAPALDELFTAERGRGAFLNGCPIRVSGSVDIHRSLISTGFHAYIVGEERASGQYQAHALPGGGRGGPALPTTTTAADVSAIAMAPPGVGSAAPPAPGLPSLPSSPAIDSALWNLRAALVLGRDVRRAGAAALDMCYVACGRLDMYFEAGPREWDFAAGQVIVEEAGGYVCDFTGRHAGSPASDQHPDRVGPFDLGSRQVVAAASRQLAESICPYLVLPR
ncbi:hypothetical protein H696_03079 [Fonticula alba]|uniref:Inositol-1-monophosphatase n=1 Tax=Fonticula alba TaxID=691883 RepID=A0A058Z9W7_FONAL|nr:hypothetical protein H696_03079 [Fonticula alba]KCV70728.1 hypothetical protein H696_03079 [Fonticula alba]|eukprot:XP_009495244.1 hypothetical protein H696_03079 [Fonticula alba]